MKSKRKKAVGNPLEVVEELLINLVAKTQEIYEMVFTARQCKTKNEFFTDLAIKHKALQKIGEKTKSVQQFLKTNCDVL